jgi:hypothetical protein
MHRREIILSCSIRIGSHKVAFVSLLSFQNEARALALFFVCRYALYQLDAPDCATGLTGDSSREFSRYTLHL